MRARLLLLLFVLPCMAAAASERPSFLWLSLEDTGTQLGAYGDRGAVTPHIDAIASPSAMSPSVPMRCARAVITGARIAAKAVAAPA